ALGSDTPVYLWWTRRTAILGFRSALAGARPGTVGPLAALSGALHVRAGTVIAALQPALAVAVGLATGALVEICLGRDRTRFVLVTLFTAGFLSLLVPGYLSTLTFGATFVAGFACVARSIEPGPPTERSAGAGSWPAVVGAGLLFGAAGLAHPLFLGLGAAVLGGAILALLLPDRPRHGLRSPSPGALRLAGASAAAAALTVAGLVYVGRAARHAVQTSRDSILRTVGLGRFSRSSYLRVLSRFFPWYRTV